MRFADIIGQRELKERLLNMCSEGRIPHAMLFLGVEGCGTLPMAYAFAQYMLCTGDKSSGDSCGICPACVKMRRLVHPDVHSIFPITKNRESDTGSDSYLAEWREMNERQPYFSLQEWVSAMGGEKQALIAKDDAVAIHKKLGLKPYEADKQILVLWRPELMNETASNRLLKILEEPPTDTLFLLVSEDTSAILPTILSRTQMFRVAPIDEAEMANALTQRYSLDEEAARQVAHVAQGSMVSAAQIVEGAEEATENLQTFMKIMRTCYTRDVVKMASVADECHKMSRERFKAAMGYCLRMVRESFVRNLGEAKLNYMNADEEAFVVKFAPFVHVGNVEGISALFDKAIACAEQNGSIKMVMMDTLMNMTVLIKSQRETS